MSRPPSSLVAQRNKGLLQRIRALKAEHPFWGYRRIWAYLRVVEQLPVNRKRIVRLSFLSTRLRNMTTGLPQSAQNSDARNP